MSPGYERQAGEPEDLRGLVVINTGLGKGKTTAALGVMLRAWGSNLRSRMFQFIKNTNASFGEHRAARRLEIPIEARGNGCTRRSKDLDQARALAVSQWQRCKATLENGDEDIVVLDEFTYPLHFGWISVADVTTALKRRRPGMQVIITGRFAPQDLIDFADVVTEMDVVKHPYRDQGIKAQLGIEL
ncbi:MAG: cob(I)yrinic acid a,c-diamide adenosyltransferase [Chloroflexi bacterium]|nr:cob(I)yrinic acid a,c-diamide adenosyltransferase [Chloroflexota bacterium]